MTGKGGLHATGRGGQLFKFQSLARVHAEHFDAWSLMLPAPLDTNQEMQDQEWEICTNQPRWQVPLAASGRPRRPIV